MLRRYSSKSGAFSPLLHTHRQANAQQTTITTTTITIIAAAATTKKDRENPRIRTRNTHTIRM